MSSGSDTIIKIGPFGGKDGKYWDAKGQSDIVQIFVSHGQYSISSIQYQYVENGNLMLSELIGSQSNGCKYDVVTLNYPKEYITCIRGYTSGHSFDLCSIAFSTNLHEYGPFGSFVATNEYGPRYGPQYGPQYGPFVATKESEFKIKLGGNQFYGFHGTTDNECVKSIGVYMKLNTTLNLVKKEKQISEEKLENKVLPCE